MGVSMFFISRDKKIALMFVGCMTMTLLRLNVPFFKSAHLILVFFFLFSEYNHFYYLIKTTKKSPINYLLIIIVISVLVAILFSPHLQSFEGTWTFIKNEFLLKYFVLIYAFYAIKSKREWDNMIKITIIPMFILTWFGIINLTELRSSFVTEMMSNWDQLGSLSNLAGDTFIERSRYRVQAMFYNPFDYGYICMILFFVYLNAYIRKTIGKLLFISLIICCWFGIIMCAARTVVFCAICGLIVYFLFSIKSKYSVRFVVFSFLFGVMAYSTIPIVNEKVNQVTTIFADREGNDVAGSNIEMRTIQMATVLSYIDDTPFFGRGVHFFYIDMGWSKGGKDGLKDSRFEGLEGVYLSYLLERGWIGYLLYLLFWFSILIYFILHMRTCTHYALCGITIWIVFFLFSHMTGELLSVVPTLIIFGSLIGICHKNDSMSMLQNKLLDNKSSKL